MSSDSTLLRAEVARLTTRCAALELRSGRLAIAANDHAARAIRARTTTMELQRVIRHAAGAEPSAVVVSLVHTGRLVRGLVVEVEALRARARPAEVAEAVAVDLAAHLRDLLARAERGRDAEEVRAEALAAELRRERQEREVERRVAAERPVEWAEAEAALRAEAEAAVEEARLRAAGALAAAQAQLVGAAERVTRAQRLADSALKQADTYRKRAERAVDRHRRLTADAVAVAVGTAERTAAAASAAQVRAVEEARQDQASLRARVAALEAELRARPAPTPTLLPPALSEAEQVAAAERLARSPRVVAALSGVDVAAMLRSPSPLAVALGRLSLGGTGDLMARAGLVLTAAQAWAKGVR